MIGGLTALILLTSLSLIQTADVLLQIPRTEAELGEDLTLKCRASGDKVGLFFWYKMKFGYMIQTVAEGAVHKEITLQGQFNNSRFSIAKVGSLFHLSIKNVSADDEGTYLCQSGAAYSMTFINGIILDVNDPEKQQKDSPVEKRQEPFVIIILGTLLGLCVIVIGVLICSRE